MGTGLKHKHRGYTIIEVMIFMAVSGFMFVIAAGFISGKQSKAEFKQSMSAINSDVQRVINDVSNGFYPSNSDFGCKAVPSGGPPNPSSPPKSQGTNQGCVFGGKVIQFGPHGTNDAGYNIYSVAERQFAPRPPALSDTTLPTNFNEAQPVVVPNLIERKTLEWGATVCGVKNKTSGSDIGAVGFFQSFGSYSGGSLESGAQSVAVVNVGLTRRQSESQTASDIIGLKAPGNPVESHPDIEVAFKSDNGQFATLTIGGGNGQRLTTAIKIINSSVCTW